MSYWKATQAAERKKLNAPESGWRLPGLCSPVTGPRRPRNGNGVRRPELLSQARLRLEELSLSDEVSSSDGEWKEWSSEEGSYCVFQEAEDEKQLLKEREKPPATRVIVEVNALTRLFEGNVYCPQYAGSITLEVKTLCLASSLVVSCNDVNCGFVLHGDPPATTTVHERVRDYRERSTNYAANVLYVLAFLSMGDGCSEAARLLELLGLPNDTTMESRSFTIIEDRIGPVVQ
jgi:hypothetical protein